MIESVPLVFGIVFVGVVTLMTLALLRSMMHGVKARGRLPYVPIPIVFPPIPVERTAGVVMIGALAITYSSLHLIACGYWWARGDLVPQITAAYLGSIYTSFASVLVCIGGIMLLALRPFGRRLISWGLMLLGLLAFFGLIMALRLPKHHEAELWAPEVTRMIAAGMAGHILIDTLVGMLGQRVGRPPDALKREAPSIVETTGDGWDL